MSLEEIFNSISLFFASIKNAVSNFFQNIWTANLYNETFLKIIIFVIVYIFTIWLSSVIKENQKKIKDSDTKIKLHETRKSPISAKAILVGQLVFAYAVTGLIVMFFDIDKINN